MRRSSRRVMLAFEWLVVGYVGALAGIALVSMAEPRARLALAASAGVLVTVVLAAGAAPLFLRLLLPALYLVGGYWIPALLVPATARASSATRFETWLTRTDAACRSHLPDLPRVLQLLTETAYLLCYPLVPLSFLVVWLEGSVADVARFWTTVLLAGFASYASLPWLVSRPPQPSLRPRARVGHLNRYILARVSHSWTTFPSGHVAVSWAAALAVGRLSPVAGLCIALVALGVTVGAASGRYHYVVDVVAGVVVAILAVVIT